MAEENAKSKGIEPLANVGATKSFRRDNSERKWLLVDAAGQSVGRLATQVAMLLRGKHKPTFTPHDDVGDFVVVINASQAEFRGNDKAKKKVYFKHTGYMGNAKYRTGEEMMANKPEKVIELAVWGMMPRGALANAQRKKLKIYAGNEHPHKAQNPEPIKVGDQSA
ncbi:MAG: 50S ribosomal protein L13 [Myxococcota bacterium]